jgi:hypothetical protein
VRQSADADPVDSRLGDRSDIGERDAPGCFQEYRYLFRISQTHGLAKFVNAHVVEKNQVGSFKNTFELNEVIHFDVYRFGTPRLQQSQKGVGDRVRFVAQSSEMIVFNENGFQSHAMVVTAATANGILFQESPTGRRLAGVQYLTVQARNRFHEPVGQRRNAAQVLHEVERDSLGGQNAADRSGHLRDATAFAYLRAVSHSRHKDTARVNCFEDEGRSCNTGQHTLCTRLKERLAGLITRDESLARDVAVDTKVLLKLDLVEAWSVVGFLSILHDFFEFCGTCLMNATPRRFSLRQCAVL